MAIQFNIYEIFEIAEQIERNGAKFYRKAANGKIDEESRKLLLDLAMMEDRHEETFASMRIEFQYNHGSDEIYDPENEAMLYMRAFADDKVFNMNRDVSEMLTGDESTLDILKTAIGLERDSIVFYLGIKDLVRKDVEIEEVESIIQEEKSHIILLSQRIEEMHS